MPRTIRPSRIEPISLRELTVVDAFDISASMRRIVLGGDQLLPHGRDGLEIPEIVSNGFDDEIKLFFPDPVTGELTLPIQRDRVIEWPRDPRPLARTYTVRALDLAAGHLELDFVLHGTGVASTWARTCEVGDRIHIAGPKMSLLHPVGADWLLIAGDETALPAIGRWLEELPASTIAEVYVEVGGAADEQEIESAGDVRLTWVHRGPARAGSTTALADAVTAGAWHPGSPFAWVAGETLAIKPIRRWLREEKGLAPDRVEVTGYWRHTEVETLEDNPDVPDPDSEQDASDQFHELIDPLPARAVRVAATLGIAPAIRRGATTAAAVAETIGSDPAATGKLLRYLATIDVLTRTGDDYALTPIGAHLDDEEATEQLSYAHPTGRLSLALDGLWDAVRTGRAVAASTLGATPDELADGDPATAAAFELAAAEEQEWLRPAFAREYAFAAGETVTVAGEGGATLLADALAGEDAPEVTLIARPSRAEAAVALLPEAARERVSVHAGTPLDTWPVARTTLLGGALTTLPDEDAVLVLQRASAATAPGGRMLVVEHLLVEDEIDDHDAGDDLLLLCLHGSGFRTADEVRALIARAGLTIAGERVIGWGEPVFEVAVG
jgi:NADPH-dependent ferric siderophore reductase